MIILLIAAGAFASAILIFAGCIAIATASMYMED